MSGGGGEPGVRPRGALPADRVRGLRNAGGTGGSGTHWRLRVAPRGDRRRGGGGGWAFDGWAVRRRGGGVAHRRVSGACGAARHWCWGGPSGDRMAQRAAIGRVDGADVARGTARRQTGDGHVGSGHRSGAGQSAAVRCRSAREARFAGAGVVSAGASGTGWSAVPDHEVPVDGARSRDATRRAARGEHLCGPSAVQARARSAGDAAWAVAAAHQPG